MTGPVVLSNTITNSLNETRYDAQYIGDLNNRGTYSLDVSATLPKGDKGDYYKFRVTTPSTYIRFSSIQNSTQQTNTSDPNPLSNPSLTDLFTTGALQFQLVSQTGKVIADSNPNAGGAYQNYQNLTSDTNVELSAGTYTMEVSPGPNYDSTQDYGYILTMQAAGSPITGTDNSSRREFSTTVNPASTEWAGEATTTTSVTSILSASTLSTAASLQETLESQATKTAASVGSVIDLLA